MFFGSVIRTGWLPEKPWRTDAVVRLVAGVMLCCMAGGLVLDMVRYFGGPQMPATSLFLAFSISALACFTGALIVLMRPWPSGNYLHKLLVLLLCIYAAIFLTWLAVRLVPGKNQNESSTIDMVVTVLAFQGATVVLASFFLREHGLGWAEGFGLDREIGFTLVIGVMVGIFALLIAWGMQFVSGYLLDLLKFNPQQQEAVTILQNTEGWRDRLALGLATIIIAPLGEEIIFRGILYPYIKRLGYPQLALWGTAILFGAIHVNLQTFLPLVFLAIILALVYERTGNLLACITVHSLFNAVNFILLYQQDRLYQYFYQHHS